MLQLLLHALIIFSTCLLWGLPVFLLLHTKNNISFFWLRGIAGHITFLYFTGLLFISIVSSWIYLFLPLKFNYLLWITIIPAVISFILFKKSNLKIARTHYPKVNAIELLFTSSALFLFLVLALQKGINADMEMYHLQIIRWSSEYKAVPGIANIYPRLGLGSNWFNLTAFFYIPSFKNQNFTFLNFTTVIIFFIWMLNNWKHHTQSKDKNARFFSLYYFISLIAFIGIWNLFRDAVSSTNYDFIVAALIFAVISFCFESLLTPDFKSDNFNIVFLIAVSITTFKFSGIFIFLLLGLYIWIQRIKVNKLIVLSIFIIIFLPVLLKNYIITGYPLYPLPVALTNPEWQVPKSIAANLYKYILYTNRYYNQSLDTIFSLQKTRFNWIPYWFAGITIIQKAVFLLAVACGLVLFVPIKKNTAVYKTRLLLIPLFMMLIAWFFSAPDTRFAYGFLIPAAILLPAILIHKIFQPALYKLLLVTLSITLITYSLKKSGEILTSSEFLLHPKPLDIPLYKKETRDGITFFLTDKLSFNWNNRCYFTELPCLSESNPYVKPLGKTIEDGFYMSPSPDSSYINNYYNY